jgi:MFS family permease
MILGAVLRQPVAAAVLIALGTAASMFMLAAAWGTCIDIGGKHSGVVSAAMNTSGQIGSILSPLMVTYLLDRFGDWNAPLYVIGGLYLTGALFWALIDPRRRVFEQ